MNLKEVVEEIKTQINEFDIKEKIAKDLNLSLKKDKCLCFLHNEKTPSMSFDKNRKIYHCFGCGKTYDIFNHYQEHYQLNFVQAINKIIQDFNLNIQFEAFKTDRKPKKKPISHKNPTEAIFKYINTRKISDATIKYAGIKANGSNIVFEYKNELGEHVANKFRPAKKILKGNLKIWFEEGTNINTLYNMDKVNVTEALVICEGEFDCLALIESGYKNVVSIPTGAKSFEWIEINYSWLEQFKEIILWFDNDDTGREGIKNIIPRIPSDVVKIVRVKHDIKDINELLFRYGSDAVLEELKNAQEMPLENIINPLAIEDYNVYEAEKIRSSIKDLDNIILGFVAGTINVLTGYNGSGKSTLVNQMCVAESISQGYRTFVYSGELTKSNLMYWITQTICDEEHLIQLTNKENKKYKKASETAALQIKKWLDDKLVIYENDFDNTADTILKTMERVAKRKGVKCFVLDNLMTIDLGCNSHE